MDAFKNGYEFFIKQNSSVYGAIQGENYVSNIESEINKFETNINSFKGFHTCSDKLKGDVAEYWHSGTFNIDAAVKGKNYTTMVDRSHGLGSADITSNFGKEFGLKYYGTAADSAKQQAKSIFERYKEYASKGGKLDVSEYLKANNITENSILSDPIYLGQVRIIPSDQLEDAIKILENKIIKESVNRPDEVERYRETLNLLRSKISHDGTESRTLSNEEAKRLADLAKEGNYDATESGISTEELIKYGDILNQAWKAGLSAAAISVVLKVGPEIFKSIEYLIKNGYVDEEQFKKIGFTALTSSCEGFIRGSVAASITVSCKAGLLGAELKSVNPTIIGTVTVLVMNTLQSAFLVVAGKKTSKEMVEKIIEDMFIASSSLILGSLGQTILANLPIVGFMLGSFVGSIVGSFVYKNAYSLALSFCINSGFTMFGLVEQSYELPTEILEEIGIDIFEYDKFEYEEFEYDKFEYEEFEYDEFKPDGIELMFLKRGVIGINKIGYIC